MEKNSAVEKEIEELVRRLGSAEIPPQLKIELESSVDRLSRMLGSASFAQEYDSLSRYLLWVVDLPWNRRSQDNLDLKVAREILEKNHYGMWKIKDRILEYLAVRNLNSGKKVRSAEILCFTGLPGIGKTSIAGSIAEALGRKFIRIPFGGIGDVAQLKGVPRHFPSAEPGQLLKNLRRCQTKNPVILFDEVDRVDERSRSAIMGVLLELLDPEQNDQFVDYYLDYPFDLSEVLFVTTANNTHGIANAVLDRLEVIEMPSYTDEEKRIIGRDYLLPKAMSGAGVSPRQLQIDENLWPKIIRPLGYDAGIRTLERTLEGICRKVARKIVEGEVKSVKLGEDNIKDFLPGW